MGVGVRDLLPRKARDQGLCKKDKCWPGGGWRCLELSGGKGGWGRLLNSRRAKFWINMFWSCLQPPAELIWGVELEWGQGEVPS